MSSTFSISSVVVRPGAISVDPETTALWMVIFAPSSYPSELMQKNVRFACAAMERHLAPEGRQVVTAGAMRGAG